MALFSKRLTVSQSITVLFMFLTNYLASTTFEDDLLRWIFQSHKNYTSRNVASFVDKRQCECQCDLEGGIKYKVAIEVNQLPKGSFDERGHTPRHMIVCYYTNWAQYRPDEWVYRPDNIDYTLCSHYIYAFAVMDNTTYEIKSYEWNDEDNPQTHNAGMYRRFVERIERGTGLPLLAVGGWNFGMETASKMMSVPKYRATFVRSCVNLLRKYGFKGLDVDFEYPGNEDLKGKSEDRHNFILLLQELKEAFEVDAKSRALPRLLLSAAVAPLANRADKAYESNALHKYLDFISVMAYDLHGSWETKIGFNAPLLPQTDPDELCARNAIDYWLNVQRFPAERINFGFANYGRSFSISVKRNNSETHISVVGPGNAGPTTREPGVLSYFEIMNMLSNETAKDFKWKRVFNELYLVPSIHNDDQWIGYDDMTSILLKTEFAKCRGLGGIMFWTIDMDDFLGKTVDQFGRQGVPHPLIKIAKYSLSNPPLTELCQLLEYNNGI